MAPNAADAADVVAQEREAASTSQKRLAEAEMRFQELSGRLAEMLAKHRAMGDPNAPKNFVR